MQFNPDTLDSVVALVTAAGAVVTYFVKRATTARTVGERLSVVQDLARIAVRAAEERFNDPDSGQDKYDLAASVLSDGARRLHVKLSADEVEGFVHAALREMNALEALPLDVEPREAA